MLAFGDRFYVLRPRGEFLKLLRKRSESRTLIRETGTMSKIQPGTMLKLLAQATW
jgi:hypothetical protein